jgi:hypothetical protein
MLGGMICVVAMFLVAFVIFLWGISGYLLGYYRRGDQILRGDEARMQSLKAVLFGFVLMALVAIVGSKLLHD